MSTTKQKNEWISKKKDRINLLVDKGRKSEYALHAQENGESLNAFINRAIENQIQRDQEQSGLMEVAQAAESAPV